MEATPFYVDAPEQLVQLGPDFFAPKKRKRGKRKKRKPDDMPRARRLKNRLEIFERYDFRCAYCNVDLTRDLSTLLAATLDHFVPHCDGGVLLGENAVPSCWSCNNLKDRSRPDSLANARKLVARRYKPFHAVLTEARRRAAKLRQERQSVLRRLFASVVRRVIGGGV